MEIRREKAALLNKKTQCISGHPLRTSVFRFWFWLVQIMSYAVHLPGSSNTGNLARFGPLISSKTSFLEGFSL
ncbi:MAG: hypothetical protein R3264_09780, partial [Anaerolineae bacterium]|nr:hypothetical protein [Anaerolineae bacterium]